MFLFVSLVCPYACVLYCISHVCFLYVFRPFVRTLPLRLYDVKDDSGAVYYRMVPSKEFAGGWCSQSGRFTSSFTMSTSFWMVFATSIAFKSF